MHSLAWFIKRQLYPSKGLLLFDKSYAESVIGYGLLVYGSAAKTSLEKIEKAQRIIWRAIFFPVSKK